MADVELKVTADLDQATKEVSGFRREYQDMVRAVEKPLRQVDALQKTQESAKAAAAAFFAARGRITNLQEALTKVRGPADALSNALAEARKQSAAAAAALDNQKRKVDEQRLAVQQARVAYDALRTSMATGGTNGADVTASRAALQEQVELLRRQQVALKEQRSATTAAAAGVKQLEAAYEQALAPVRLLERDMVAAERALASSSREFDRQKTSVREQRDELRRAGVDTRNLASEQERLARELNAAVAAGRNDQAVAGIRARAAALAQVAREQRAANLEAARENLGVNRYRQLQGELVQVRSQYQLLRTAGNLTGRELSIAQRAMTERVRETQRALREMNAEQRRASGVSSLAGGIGGAIGAVGGGYAAVSAVSAVARAADAYNLMNARLRLATTSQEGFNVAQRELSRIAQETEAPVQSLITLYGRISRPLREAGRSQQDILAVTEAVSTSFRVSGATAQEAENGVIQFAQALGAGALRGEEFNSVAEQAPRLMQALADGIGVPVGALKEMAAQGQLTAQVVTDALTGQLETLRKEAETLPDTVGGAMTKLADTWRAAVGKADVQPLIDSINSLGKTLSDPVVVDNLVTLASALASLAGTVVDGASEFVDFGKRIAFIAANSQGLVTELDKVDQQIADLDRSLAGTGLSTTIDGLLYSKEELKAKRDALVAYRKAMVQEQSGLNSEVQALAAEAASAAQAARDKEISAYAASIAELDALRKRQVKAAEDAAKALVNAEKKAVSDLQKVRDERLSIEQRYEQAIADLSRGPKGDQNYLTALSLRQSAEQALANGDIAGAQKQAQAALKVIQELVEAGDLGMTVGIKDFIRSLGEIELEANSIAESNAADQLASIRDEMQQLKDKAKELEGMPVSVKTDEASIEAVRTAIEGLIAQLGQKDVVIPVRFAHPDGPIIKDLVAPQDTVMRDQQVPQFATGGILRGPGTGTSDSILARLSNGEGVVNARAVQHYGAELIHQLNGLRVPRFATGGVMGNVPVPSIPPLAPALQLQLDGRGGGSADQDWGSMVIDLGSGPAPIRMPRSTAEALRREALKRGSPGRAR